MQYILQLNAVGVGSLKEGGVTFYKCKHPEITLS